MRIPLVRPHPQGGYTVAVPVPGSLTACTYEGQYAVRSNAVTARNARRCKTGTAAAHLLPTLRKVA